MRSDPDLAGLAGLLAEPARAAILAHLLDGRSWTATELARVAGVGAPTASVHLRRLLDGGLLATTAQGRHRYFRLASDEVATMIEWFARHAPTPAAKTPGERRASAQLRRCRLCFDHVAGQLGVALAQRLVALEWLVEEDPWYRITDSGTRALAQLGVAADSGRTCMDWSERRLHIAGALGRELARQFIDRQWLVRDANTRALWPSPSGLEQLQRAFGLESGDVGTR